LRLSLGPTGHKTSAPLELIFSDVWGPAPLFSSDGYRYFVIFVDVHTKYIWYYPLVAKSDIYSVFHQFQTLVERQFSHIVETGLTLLGQCKAPFRFWNYAFETSVYLINHMPTLVLANRSPFDCLFQRSPDYHFFVYFWMSLLFFFASL
jgi:histone deacetylase 1/2